MTHNTAKKKKKKNQPDKVSFRSINWPEMYVESYIYSLIINNLLSGAPSPEFRPKKGLSLS